MRTMDTSNTSKKSVEAAHPIEAGFDRLVSQVDVLTERINTLYERLAVVCGPASPHETAGKPEFGRLGQSLISDTINTLNERIYFLTSKLGVLCDQLEL